MQALLNLIPGGSMQNIKDLYDSNPDVSYQRDSNNNNSLGLAILHGRWDLAIFLLKYCRVSPHIINSNGESLFHLIARGLKIKRPVISDYRNIREENLAYWRKEEERELARIEEISRNNPDLKPPVHLFVKKPENLDSDIFGNPDLFFPKYIMMKYHVVLTRNNNEGMNPADLANQLQEPELFEYYSQQMKPHEIRKRIVSGLNENLVRDIASYL